MVPMGAMGAPPMMGHPGMMPPPMGHPGMMGPPPMMGGMGMPMGASHT